MIQLEEKVLEHDSAIEEKVMNILEKLGALSSNKQRFKGYRCESEGHFKLMSVCRHLST